MTKLEADEPLSTCALIYLKASSTLTYMKQFEEMPKPIEESPKIKNKPNRRTVRELAQDFISASPVRTDTDFFVRLAVLAGIVATLEVIRQIMHR